MMANVVPVYEFMEDKEKAEVLRKSFEVRSTTLKIVWAIPEYKEAPLETKNWLYDVVRDRLFTVPDYEIN